MKVKVFLLKDVEKVGLAGEIIEAADGYAQNYLLRNKLGVIVTKANEASLKHKVKVVEHRKEVIATKTSMLAEKIKSLSISIKCKVHDDDKLYGSIGAADIVELLNAQGVKVAKNQVVLDKAIKSKGTHEVKIKLSNQLQPVFKLKIQPE